MLGEFKYDDIRIYVHGSGNCFGPFDDTLAEQACDNDPFRSVASALVQVSLVCDSFGLHDWLFVGFLEDLWQLYRDFNLVLYWRSLFHGCVFFLGVDITAHSASD